VNLKIKNEEVLKTKIIKNFCQNYMTNNQAKKNLKIPRYPID